jgi:hypothetical protein
MERLSGGTAFFLIKRRGIITPKNHHSQEFTQKLYLDKFDLKYNFGKRWKV